jgi:NAD(P)-dependent dehydrogenase (short-subunit alcohol dehydrogenase family)
MSVLVAGALNDFGRAIARTLVTLGEKELGALLLVDPDVAACRAWAAELADDRIEVLDHHEVDSRRSLGLVVQCVPATADVRLDALDLEDWDAEFDAVTRGPWKMMKASAAALGRSGGRFVTVLPPCTARAAPAATAFLTEALAGELERGAQVNLVRGDKPGKVAEVIAALATRSLPLVGSLSTGIIAPPAAPPRPHRDTVFPKRPASILITGGGGLIARSLCRALNQGTTPVSVLLVDRDADQLSAAVEDLRDERMRIETCVADLADPATPTHMVDQAVALFGGLDAVFSHAGVGRPDPVTQTSDADFDLSFAVNLRASWLLAKAAAPFLTRSGGSFVATGTIGALRAGMSAPIYSASKAALLALIEQLAVEWGPAGVRVNAVSPGSTLTPMNRLWSLDETARAPFVAAYPLGRLADPAEIAAAAAFLASPAASYISGHNLVVDGALSRLDR